jgi:hypothetical protein
MRSTWTSAARAGFGGAAARPLPAIAAGERVAGNGLVVWDEHVPVDAMPTLAPSASDRDGSSSQIRMRIASTSPAGERAYGAPAVDASVRRRIRPEYAGTALSGGGARLGVGTGPPSQRRCAGMPRSPGPAGAAGAAEAERADPSPRRRPLAARCSPRSSGRKSTSQDDETLRLMRQAPYARFPCWAWEPHTETAGSSTPRDHPDHPRASRASSASGPSSAVNALALDHRRLQRRRR